MEKQYEARIGRGCGYDYIGNTFKNPVEALDVMSAGKAYHFSHITTTFWMVYVSDVSKSGNGTPWTFEVRDVRMNTLG
jgi:hypothetical protein